MKNQNSDDIWKMLIVLSLLISAGVLLWIILFTGFKYQEIKREMLLSNLSVPYISRQPNYKNQKQLIASWYSRKECMGCREDRLMANGEFLNDKALTAAYNYLPLNSSALICLLKIPYRCVRVRITDRVGRDNRIDLSYQAFSFLANHQEGIKKVILYY